MEKVFLRFEAAVPQPQFVAVSSTHMAWRYVEQTIEQALVQKLARIISGLRALDLLFQHGQFQEQGVLQRMLDETTEDIHLLAQGATGGIEPIHTDFLAEFWKEEIDSDAATLAPKRGMIRRDRIRKHLIRQLPGTGFEQANKAGKTIHKMYSGFVHGASPHIMDMCGGFPPKFYLAGMNGTPRVSDFLEDAGNYFYRGLLAATVVAKAFGDEASVALMYSYLGHYEGLMGSTYMRDVSAGTHPKGQ